MLARSRCAVAGIALLAGTIIASAPGCSEDPIVLPLRSLHASGPFAFVCLGAPTGDAADFARPLSHCSGTRTATPDDYTIPHLYALVTQPIRGEVAVVDLTTQTDAVLDLDPVVPGANFLPVGAQPVSIVATPGAMAAFVATAEPNFEGIFALPTHMVRPGTMPRLSSWPSCSLPATPGTMVLAYDPPDDSGQLRPSCDAAYGEPDTTTCGPESLPHCHGDLNLEEEHTKKPGRYKLVITLPSEGGFAVVDAQNVLDREPGEFAPCEIERWVPLKVELSIPPIDPPPEPAGCVNDIVADDPYADAFVPQPTGVALDGDRLYVADRGAPVIHVVDLPNPCEPIERPPLLPRAAEDPSAIVTTGRIAVSPPTLDLKRYLYATDIIDGSVMMFDISDGAPGRTPIERETGPLNPFQPLDRIRFQAIPRDVLLVQHHGDSHDSQTGSSIPIRCDPDPQSTGPGTVYRPNTETFDTGASPWELRGVFGFIVLSSGDIVVVDVDDYDAPCRGPRDTYPQAGCDEELTDLYTTGEYSCNAVSPHEPRSGGVLVQTEGIANNVPGVRTFPVLFDSESTALIPDDETEAGLAVPRMRATVPVSTVPAFALSVGSEQEPLDPQSGAYQDAGGQVDPSEHTLAMNLEDPRAHIVDQNWAVTYEGFLGAFSGHFAELTENSDGSLALRDVSSRFCDSGVLSEAARRDMLIAQGEPPATADTLAASLADYVQIYSSMPVDTDAYWTSQAECTYTDCQSEYGSVETPRLSRDFRISEATNDMLTLRPRHGTADPRLKCCFPAVVEFRVRAGTQWVVWGDGVGLLHHVITDPETGVCRNNCDPTQQRLNSRVREVPPDSVLSDDDPLAFFNPFFRFTILQGTECDDQGGNCGARATDRDAQFQFTSQGRYFPMLLTTVIDTTSVQPQVAEYLEATGELVISDGALEGLTFISLDALAVTRQYN